MLIIPITLFTVTTTCIQKISTRKSITNHCEISSPNDFENGDFIFTMVDNSQTVSVKCPLKTIEGSSYIPSIVLKSDSNNPDQVQNLTVVEIQSKCFENQKGLTSITLPETIAKLGDFSFKGCTSLSFITLPNAILSIPKYCFFECITLESIIVSPNMTSIDDYAFHQCPILRYFTLPSQLHTIGANAFSNCQCAFHDLEIPHSIEIINAYSFSECISIESLSLHSNIQKIDNQAFCLCTQLTRIVFDDLNNSLNYLGSKVFAYTSLQRFSSFNLSQIGQGCFMNCNKLINVNLSGELESLSSDCFNNCTDLQSIILPPNLKTIDNSAFKFCSSIQQIQLPDMLSEIGDFAFMQCAGLTTINFPPNLTKIGQSSFALCSKLAIPNEFPNQLESIGAFAFANCPIGTKQIILPPSLTKIGNNPFKMAAIEEITMNESGKYVIANQSVLYAFTSENDKKVVGFARNSPVESIEILEGTTKIGIDAFYNVMALQTITFPESLTSIEAEAFESALSLQKVVLPSHLKTIGGEAFQYCLNLKGIIEIQASVNSIGICAFCSTGIEWFHVHPNNKFFFSNLGCLYTRQFSLIQYPNGFTNHTEFEIPDGTLKIGHSSFKYNDRIESVIMSETVSEIEDEAFMKMPNLRHVVLNDNLKVIGSLAFSNLNNLQEITFPSSLTQLNKNAFQSTPLHSIVFKDCNLDQDDIEIFDLSKIACVNIPFTCNESFTWSLFPDELINTPNCFIPVQPTPSPTSSSIITSLRSYMYIFVGIMALICISIIVVVSFKQYRKRTNVMKDPNIIESWIIPDSSSAPIDYYTSSKNH